MKTLRTQLRIVFYRDEDQWVAHCLEFDTIGHGETKSKALDMLFQACMIQITESFASGNMKNLFTPADPEFFAMFAAGRNIAVRELSANISIEDIESDNPIEIEGMEAREYSGNELALAE